MPIIGYSSRCFAAAVPGATRHKLRTTEHTRPADLRPLNYGLATAQNRATRDDANVDDKLLKEEQEKKKKAGTRHKRLLNEPSSGRSTDGQWPMPVVLVSTRPGDLAISKPAPWRLLRRTTCAGEPAISALPGRSLVLCAGRHRRPANSI